MAGEPAWLAVTGEDGGRRFVRLDLAVTTIGRNEGNVLDLLDRKLSRFHCEIHRRGDAYFLRDCGSRNGTILNGQRLANEVPLGEGDTIAIGSSSLVFKSTRPPEAGPRDQAQLLPAAPGKTATRRIVELGGNTPDEPFDPRPTLQLPASALPAAVPEPIRLAAPGKGALAAIQALADALPGDVPARLAALARELVPARQASVLLPAERAGEPPRVAALAPASGSARFSSIVVEEVLSGGQPVQVLDAKRDARYENDVSVLGLNLRGLVAVPLRARGRTVGVLYLDDPALPEQARDDALIALRTLASVGGLALAPVEEVSLATRARTRRHDEAPGEGDPLAWVRRVAATFAPVTSVDLAARLVPLSGALVASATLPERDGARELALLFGHVAAPARQRSALAQSVIFAFRALVRSATSSDHLLGALEDLILPELDGCSVAAALLRLDPRDGRARLACAGLGPVLHRKASGEVVPVSGAGAAFGSGVGAAGIVERAVAWEPGEHLLLAAPPALLAASGAWFSSAPGPTAAAILDGVFEARASDIAGACVLRRLPT